MIKIETAVGEIAKEHFQTVEVFDRYQIDFCCGGKQSLKDACDRRSLIASEVLKELEASIQVESSELQFHSMRVDELIDYIVNNHHSFVRRNIPLLTKLLDKIEEVHGKKHPELSEVNSLFKESAGQLIMHMQKEEVVLFPLVQKLQLLQLGNRQIAVGIPLSVASPVAAMVKEHENEGARFERIGELTNNYQIPEDACSTFRAAYETLQAFEKDLHRHIHLENNILFPMAVQLEEDIIKKN